MYYGYLLELPIHCDSKEYSEYCLERNVEKYLIRPVVSLTWSEHLKIGFLETRLYYKLIMVLLERGKTSLEGSNMIFHSLTFARSQGKS